MSDMNSELDQLAHDSVHDDGDHEEPWLISYADLMTLLFGFFVIMFSLSKMDDSQFSIIENALSATFHGTKKSEISKDNSDSMERVISNLARVFGIGGDGVGGNAGNSAKQKDAELPLSDGTTLSQKALRDHEKMLASAVSKTGASISSKNSFIDIQLPEKMLFKQGRFELDDKGSQGLVKIAKALKGVEKFAEVHIIGHTDSVPPGKNMVLKDNFTLSAARAGSVARFLMAQGVQGKALRPMGMANLQPLAPDFDASGKPNRQNMAKNRRVQILVRQLAETDTTESVPNPTKSKASPAH